MPQLSLSVSAQTAARLRTEAAARNCSVSKVLAELVERGYAVGWPPGYIDGIRARAQALDADYEFVPPPRLGDRDAPDLSAVDE